MAIKRLKKITLYGPAGEKSSILKELQSLGCLHLIPMTEKAVDVQVQPAEASEAKAWLERSPKRRRQVRNFRERNDAARVDDIVHKILDNKSRFREQSDVRDKLQERIREVRPWGEFTFPALSDLNGQRLWFYVLPNGELPALKESLQSCELPWELITRVRKTAMSLSSLRESRKRGCCRCSAPMWARFPSPDWRRCWTRRRRPSKICWRSVKP